MNTDTFHVFVRVRSSAQHRIVLMAESHEAARIAAEADGWEVLKVRRAPTPAKGGRIGQSRSGA